MFDLELIKYRTEFITIFYKWSLNLKVGKELIYRDVILATSSNNFLISKKIIYNHFNFIIWLLEKLHYILYLKIKII